MTAQEFIVILIGLGLAGSLLAVIYIVKRKQSQKLQESLKPKMAVKNQTTQQAVGEPVEAEDLDAKRIHDYMNSLPPAQVEDTAKKYEGRNIMWEINFEYINSRQGSVINAMCYYRGDYPWIYFTADMNEFPHLKHLHSGQKMILKGMIEKYDISDGGFHVIPHDITAG